jgi:hypothetical protein
MDKAQPEKHNMAQVDFLIDKLINYILVDKSVGQAIKALLSSQELEACFRDPG